MYLNFQQRSTTIAIRYATAEVNLVIAEVHPRNDERLHSELIWRIVYTASDLSFPMIVVNRDMRFPILDLAGSLEGKTREHFGRCYFAEELLDPEAPFQYLAEIMIARHTPMLPLHHLDFSKAKWKITAKASQ